ncbi:MAG: hypothetical protein Q4C91_13235 [Eubacteriales bacterium]|nr:hypothetical protein [Eubacteriales bacterium]
MDKEKEQKENALQGSGPKKQKKSRLVILLAALVIAVIAAAVLLWARFFRYTPPVLAPDQAPAAEENAEDMEGEQDTDKMEAEEGGGAVTISYEKEVLISLSDQTASLVFQNPTRSVNDMVLQLAIVSEDGTETVIAQSGTLHPGKELNELVLIEDAAVLSEGVYNGEFIILYYDPDTGEKAMVNTKITGIEISVNE